VESAIVDPALRGQTLEVGGPENLSVTEFLDVFRSETASNGKVGHIPLAGMRVGAIVMKLMDPSMARTIQGAVVMDTRPQSFNASETRRSFPSIPVTSLAEVVRRDYADSPGVARVVRSGP
jgi:NADH dehydrogenase